MTAIKNILVCLDLTEIDHHLIKYSVYAAEVFQAENVTFIHAIQAYDLPDRRKKSFPDVKNSLNSIIREELDARISGDFQKKFNAEVAVRIAEEDAANSILEAVDEMQTDLMFLGQKHGEDRHARYGRRVAAESDCDIFFVPEDPPEKISVILCALDYSDESRGAFDRAAFLQETLGARIICYYIQNVTKSYFPASTTTSASRSQSRAESRHRDLISAFGKNPDDYPCRINTTDELISEAEKICRTAEEENADIVIAGATGSTANETSLLGNISETLRRMEKYIPVMIVKHGEEKKFFSRLLK